MPNLSKIHPDLAVKIDSRMAAAEWTPLEQLRVIVQFQERAMRAVAQIDGILATHRAFYLISATAYSVTRDAVYALSERDSVDMI